MKSIKSREKSFARNTIRCCHGTCIWFCSHWTVRKNNKSFVSKHFSCSVNLLGICSHISACWMVWLLMFAVKTERAAGWLFTVRAQRQRWSSGQPSAHFLPGFHSVWSRLWTQSAEVTSLFKHHSRQHRPIKIPGAHCIAGQTAPRPITGRMRVNDAEFKLEEN